MSPEGAEQCKSKFSPFRTLEGEVVSLLTQGSHPGLSNPSRRICVRLSAYIFHFNSSKTHTPLNLNNPQKYQSILNIHLNPPQIITHRTQPVTIVKNHKHTHRQMIHRNLPFPVLILNNLQSPQQSIRKLGMIPQLTNNSTFQKEIQPNLPVMFNNLFYEHTAFLIQHIPIGKSNTKNGIQSFTSFIKRKSINFTVKFPYRGNPPPENLKQTLWHFIQKIIILANTIKNNQSFKGLKYRKLYQHHK